MTKPAPYDAGAMQSRGVACVMHETKEEVRPPLRGAASESEPRQDPTETHSSVVVSAPLSAPPSLHPLPSFPCPEICARCGRDLADCGCEGGPRVFGEFAR